MRDPGDMRDNPRVDDPRERDMRDETDARERGTVREPVERRDETMARGDTMRPGDTMAREDAMARENATARKDAPTMPTRGHDGGSAAMWPDMTDLRHRFDALQSEFIDDPKGAVNKAEHLINEVVERITKSMHERMHSMHKGVEGTNDTEQLRQTMRGYRDLVDWMESRRAA